MNENLIKIKKQRDYLQPMTNLKLLMTDVEIDNKNQLTFSNLNDQFSYFSTLPSLEYENFTFQRKDSIIRFPENIDNLYHYNYCMYQNENFGNKWFYAFIESMEYANDNITFIKIKTDVYQTWCFDINFKICFIEREHVNNDTIGNHTIPEGLETGEYIVNSLNPIQSVYSDKTYICFGLSEMPDGVIAPDNRNYNSIYSGLRYIIVKSSTDASNLIKYFDNKGKADAIVSLFLIPQTFPLNYEEWQINSSIPINYNFPSFQPGAYLIETINITRPINIDGYIPKNNKLFVYPYSYLNVSNNNGISSIFNYEDFQITNPSFNIYGNIGVGCSTRLIPQSFKGILENNEYGISGGKLPTCSWNSDVYTNWLTQNAVNNNIGILETGASILTHAVTNPLSILDDLNQATSLMNSYYQHNLIPNQVRGNTNCGDVNFSLGYADFTFYPMSIKQEYAKIIDNYFSMFGYKVNEIKIPNLRGRSNWNYIKTVNCNIIGDIPQNDMQEIKNMFNSGITLWHNHNTFLDYTKENNII